MSDPKTSEHELSLCIHDLTMRLGEAEETLRALRCGELDAVVVRAAENERIYTLRGADYAYRVLFETLNGGAVILAADASLLYANAHFSQLVGLPHDNVIGASFPDFVASADSARFRRLLGLGLQGSHKGEITLEHADGRHIPTLISLNAGQIDGPETICTMVVTDLTELHEAREALEKVNAELEQRVEQRTAELQQANAVLQEADRRKDQFLAILAHELRNPLAPIRTAVQLLQQLGSSEPRVRRAQEIIDRQVRHQARLLDDLLDVSRITQARVSLRKGWVDLSQLVQQTVEDHRGVFEEAELCLELSLPEPPVWVEGDAVRLAQVVGNLLGNAAKFTNPGGHVLVRLGWEPENEQVVLTIRDNGIGIAPEMLPRVFDRFSQEEGNLDRSRGGLGLGLALVKGLVALHGGSVRVQSEGLGHGAEFTLLFPGTLRPPISDNSAPRSTPNVGPIRVLVVEDNRDAAEILGELLEFTGCTVKVVHNGLAVMEVARQFRPEVVLCDLGLPGMNGYEVAAALQQEPATAKALLVAISGYGQEEDRERSRQAGFDLHLTKPIDFAELRQLLEISPEQKLA